MKRLAARHELDIANLTVIFESVPLTGRLKDFHSIDLLGRQGRDNTLVAEARQRLDKVRVPSSVRVLVSNFIMYPVGLNQHSLDINALLATRLNHENGVLEPRLLARRHFTLAIDVPDWRR